MNRRQVRVTIVDVAKRADVSVGSVSRVLNGAPNCAPELRKRVQDAVKALGYVPNHAAQSLKRNKTDQIELVIPDIANPVYVAMAKTVQQVARGRGYRMSVVSTESSSLEEQLAVKNLERRYVDGLIICSLKVTSTFLKQVEAARQRVCVIGSIPEAVPVDSVRVDSAAGAGLALAHLVDTGRQRIAFINGDAHTVPAEARLRGYQAEFERQHLSFDSTLVMNTAFTVQGGYDAAATLLDRAPGIDAFFCANDLIALGALRKLQELGKNVPQEIAVVGMDNIDLTRVSNPTLSSVSLLAGERGRLAAELLLERLEEPDLEPRNIVITPRLVIRESSTGYIAGATQETGYVSV